MNTAERALLRERIKLVNILDQESEMANVYGAEDEADYQEYRKELLSEIQEIDVALKLLKWGAASNLEENSAHGHNRQ